MNLLGPFITYRFIYRYQPDSIYTHAVSDENAAGFLRFSFSQLFDTYSSLQHVVVETE